MGVAFVSELLPPIKVIEHVAAANEYPYEWRDENSLRIFVKGHWSHYEASFRWFSDLQALHMAIGFGLKAPANRLKELRILTRRLNEDLWIGHFDYWPDERLMLFRHATQCPDGETISPQQGRAMLQEGLETCDDNYPAFDLVVNRVMKAQEALEKNITETLGNA